MKCGNRVKKNSMLIALAVILTVLLCTATVPAAEYFATDGGVSVIPVFANTGAADTAMGTPVQGALIYSTSDGGIMYYDGSAWVLVDDFSALLDDNTIDAWDIQEGTNNYININTTNGSEAVAFGNAVTNPDFSFLGSGNVTATGDVDVQGGDLTNTTGALTLAPNAGTNLNVSLSGTGDMIVNTDDLVVDTSAGFVGIGDTAPSSAFHVDSGAANTTAIATIENTAGNFQIFNTSANPETVITGSSGDLAIDSTNGALYVKTDNADATDWLNVIGTSMTDDDSDTTIKLEESADDDTIRFDLGGTTPIGDAFVLNQTSGFVWNDAGDDLDVRFEGDTEANLLVLDASADRVGFGTNAPTSLIDVRGQAIFLNGTWSDPHLGTAYAIKAVGSGAAGSIAASGTAVFNDSVGIGTTSPDFELEVNGGIGITCPSGFTSIEVTATHDGIKRQLGCMQTAEEGETNFAAAADNCFDTYGGRLPSPSEQSIAFENYALTDETDDFEFVDSIGPDDYVSMGRFDGDHYRASVKEEDFVSAYRCWIDN